MECVLVPLFIICLSLELQLVSTQGCANVPHCEICDGNTCQKCNDNYFISNGGCHACAPDCPRSTYFDQKRCGRRENACQDCPDGCDRCVSALQCTECSLGYWVKNGTCQRLGDHCRKSGPTGCIECINGFTFNSQTNRCDPVRDSCSHSYCGVGRCIPLESGYTCECGSYAFAFTTEVDGVSHPTCIACGDEVLGIPDCIQCGSKDFCTVCSEGFVISDSSHRQCIDYNECEGSNRCNGPNITCHNMEGGYECRCDDGFHLHTNEWGATCKVCPMGCDLCETDTHCTACHYGYALISNVCLKCLSEGCSECDRVTLKCTKCFPGFWKVPFDDFGFEGGTGMCRPCSTNCKLCRGEENGKEICEVCGLPGYSVIDGTCQRCTTDHCVKCGPNLARCVQCSEKYVFNPNTHQCDPVSGPTETNECTECNRLAACVYTTPTTTIRTCVCNHGFEGSGRGIDGCRVMKCAPLWDYTDNTSTFTVKANSTCDVRAFEKIIVRLSSTKLDVNVVTYFEFNVGYSDQTAVVAFQDDPNDPFFVVRGSGWTFKGQAFGEYKGGAFIAFSPLSDSQSLDLNFDTPDYEGAAFDVTLRCETGKEGDFAALDWRFAFELSNHIANALGVTGFCNSCIPAEYITFNSTDHTMTLRLLPYVGGDYGDNDSQQGREWNAYDLVWLFKYEMDKPNNIHSTAPAAERVSKLRSGRISFVFGSIVSITPKTWCGYEFVNFQECHESAAVTIDNGSWLLIALVGLTIAFVIVWTHQYNKQVSNGREGYMPTSVEFQDFGVSGTVGSLTTAGTETVKKTNGCDVNP